MENDKEDFTPIDDVKSYFFDLNKDDSRFQDLYESWTALSKFLLAFEQLKVTNNLTQKEIAQKMGTTQSAISRVMRMKGKPSYQVLQKMSKAVGGDLYISPMGDYSFTIPLNMQPRIKEIAEGKGVNIKELVNTYIKIIAGNDFTGIYVSKPLTEVDEEDKNTLNFEASKFTTDGNDFYDELNIKEN